MIFHLFLKIFSGRGSNHLHFLLWTDLQPSVLYKFVDDKEVMEAICRRIDSIVQVWLPDVGWNNIEGRGYVHPSIEIT